MASTAELEVGKRVVVSRDEEEYPSKGTWPLYRGLEGTITTIVGDRRPRLVEYGVVFTDTRYRPNGSIHGIDDPVWFQRHELEVV